MTPKQTLPDPGARVDELAYRVIGAAIEVHRQLGPGLAETLYRAALQHELALHGLRVQRDVRVPVTYKGEVLGHHVLRFVVEELLVVELVAVDQLTDLHRATLVGALHAAHLELGLLINVNVALLKDGIRRVVRCRPN